ncbi:hypothetical protein [Escherichia coli]|uniref:hypothetical protein n=1 Tax=Escherichia coli TaxID=562 RepID=UPI002023ABD3|nr:hypothetical protein [Escherichia coli]
MFDDIYALYAGDLSWWKQYGYHHTGEGDSASDSQPGGGEIIFVGVQAILWTAEGVNSGAQAISLAAESGLK